MKAGKYLAACDIYKEALKNDEGNVKFHFEVFKKLGEAKFKLGKFREAYEFYTQALQLDERDSKSLFERAKSHYKLNEFVDCIIDCEESLNITPDPSVKVWIKNAEAAIKSRNPKLPHQILKISSLATEKQAKSAMYKLCGPLLVKNNPKATEIDKLKLDRKRREIEAAFSCFSK